MELTQGEKTNLNGVWCNVDSLTTINESLNSPATISLNIWEIIPI